MLKQARQPHIYIAPPLPKNCWKMSTSFSACCLTWSVGWSWIQHHIIWWGIYIPKPTVESSLADIYIGPSSSDDQSSCPSLPTISYGEVSPHWYWCVVMTLISIEWYARLLLCYTVGLDALPWLWSSWRERDGSSERWWRWEGGGSGDREGGWSWGYHY